MIAAPVEVKDGAMISKRAGVSVTEYQITGPLGSVFKAIESLFTNYPAMGYGTFVHSIGYVRNGQYSARVSHTNSCD